jgi:hypothetical protein
MATPSRNLPSWAQAGVSDGGNDGGTNPNLPSWAQGSGGGGGSVVLGGSSEFAPHAKKKSGGLFGGLRHAAHVVADKSERAAHDIKSIPGGVVQLARRLRGTRSRSPSSIRGSPRRVASCTRRIRTRRCQHRRRDRWCMGQCSRPRRRPSKHPRARSVRDLAHGGPGLHGAGRVSTTRASQRQDWIARLTERPRVHAVRRRSGPAARLDQPDGAGGAGDLRRVPAERLDKKHQGPSRLARGEADWRGSISESQRIPPAHPGG